ncbi:P-loop containing nucleoside triphosphate hydrolase protein [Salix suchowensis]|nr:P-loop containing nucleoside triphosphate hydrolase protein [Salix suchowensis]
MAIQPILRTKELINLPKSMILMGSEQLNRLGVLTKPDRIPTGEEARWLKFIQNEIEPLENNWFCVKQPSSNDLKQGVTWADARQRENEFFSMTAPWCNLESMYQKYLRTGNLVERASSILSDLISRRLPVIQEELQKALRRTEEALAAMPKEPSADAFSEVMTLLYAFIADISFHVGGVPNEDGLLQSIRPHQMQFRMAIRSTAPQFVPLETRVARDFKMTRPKFLDQEEAMDTEDADKYSPGIHYNRSSTDDVLTGARARECQIITPSLYGRTYNVLFKYMKALVHKHFASFGQGNLEQRVGYAPIQQRSPGLKQVFLPPVRRDKFLSFYKAVRQSQRNPELLASINDHLTNPPKAAVYNRNGHIVTDAVQPNGIAKILSGLAEVGISGVKPEDIPKLLPSDTMEPAITIMAEVRAYFQGAYPWTGARYLADNPFWTWAEWSRWNANLSRAHAGESTSRWQAARVEEEVGTVVCGKP